MIFPAVHGLLRTLLPPNMNTVVEYWSGDLPRGMTLSSPDGEGYQEVTRWEGQKENAYFTSSTFSPLWRGNYMTPSLTAAAFDSTAYVPIGNAEEGFVAGASFWIGDEVDGYFDLAASGFRVRLEANLSTDDWYLELSQGNTVIDTVLLSQGDLNLTNTFSTAGAQGDKNILLFYKNADDTIHYVINSVEGDFSPASTITGDPNTMLSLNFGKYVVLGKYPLAACNLNKAFGGYQGTDYTLIPELKEWLLS